MIGILFSNKFEISVMVVTLASCTIIIVQLFVSDDTIVTSLDAIDNVFLVVFVFEAAFKILALGI